MSAEFFKTKGGPVKAKAQKKSPQAILEAAVLSDQELAERLLKLWKKTKRFRATYAEFDQLLAALKYGPLAKVKVGRRVYELEVSNPFENGNVAYGHGPVRLKELKVRVDGKMAKE